MNELERFKAVVNFEEPDFWPLMTDEGVGYVHPSGLRKLHEEGLPESVNDISSWAKYWGQFVWEMVGGISEGTPKIKSEKWVEGDFEFIRYETGALTKQVIDNSTTYSMPEFMEFSVRDRSSWEKFKKFVTPAAKVPERIDEMRAKYDHRTFPIRIKAGGTWGIVREFMGPEKALLAVYDDPELVHDMIAHQLWLIEEYIQPVIKALKPEVISLWEDFCYKNGMLISPDTFREFCAPYYRRIAEIGHDCGVDLIIVDSDGKVDEFIKLLEEVGINGCWPMEQVCGNDLLKYREECPDIIFAGGIEKEIINEESRWEIDSELYPKIPEMLKRKGYFPMFDHAIQPGVNFRKLCRCMTRLHEICGSNLGEFPRC